MKSPFLCIYANVQSERIIRLNGDIESVIKFNGFMHYPLKLCILVSVPTPEKMTYFCRQLFIHFEINQPSLTCDRVFSNEIESLNGPTN